METIQRTTLLRLTRILRIVLDTWKDLLSLKIQWRTIRSTNANGKNSLAVNTTTNTDNNYYYYVTYCNISTALLNLFFTKVWIIANLFSFPKSFHVPQVISTYISWMVEILSDLQFHQSHFHVLGNCSKGSNYDWCYCHFHVPRLFQLFGLIKVSVYLFAFFYFYLSACSNGKTS